MCGICAGKAKVVLVNQINWVIVPKALETAEMCKKLMKDVFRTLQHLGCVFISGRTCK